MCTCSNPANAAPAIVAPVHPVLPVVPLLLAGPWAPAPGAPPLYVQLQHQNPLLIKEIHVLILSSGRAYAISYRPVSRQ